MRNDQSPDRLKHLAQFLANNFDSPEMLVLADQPEPIVEHLRATMAAQPEQIEGRATATVAANLSILADRRWPLVCLLEPDVDKPSLIRLLARIRDLHADWVLHVNCAEHWSLADSLALGFSQVGFSDLPGSPGTELPTEPVLQIFEFDIRRYKPEPDWLNAKNWANPEQWDKHRW